MFFSLVEGVSSFIGELHCLSLGLSDKNPISALHELCTRLHWVKPVFEMHEQDVTRADPKFLMKVLYDFFFHLIIFWLSYILYPNFCYFYETNNFIKYHDLCALEILLLVLLRRDMNCMVFCYCGHLFHVDLLMSSLVFFI